jgi:hypothetical protein
LGTAVVLALILILPRLLRRTESPDESLERQALALREPFHSDMNLVQAAPYYTIAATVDPDSGSVSGEMTVRYTNRSSAALEAIPFRLYPNAATIYGGGSMSVEAITQSDQMLTMERGDDPTILTAILDSPLAANASTTLRVAFRAQAPAGTAAGYGIFARNRGLLSLAGWYPIIPPHTGETWLAPPAPRVGDAMMAETALYDVALTVPEGYRVVATGATYDRRTAEGATTWHVVSGPAREFAAAVSNRLETMETAVGGVTLRLHTLPAGSAVTLPAEALALAAETLRVYTDHYGPYRYTELDVVHAVVPIGGYEFPGMVYVEADKRTAASRREYEYLLTHEMAHQWWYAQVGSRTVMEPWLDEGLATYSIALYRNADGSGDGDGLLNYWRRSYGKRWSNDPPLDSPALDFSGWYGYRRTVYIHGALFIEALRQTMGDEAFFELLQGLLTQYRYQVIDTDTFLRAAQETAESELGDLFAAWFDR